MKPPIKYIIFFIGSIFLLIICYLYFFLPVPDFVDKEIVKEINIGKGTVVWGKINGILDQNFPDYIIIKEGNRIDTVCQSHNIAHIKTQGDSLKIGFYGKPMLYNEEIVFPQKMLGYYVKIDTTVTK